MNAPTQPTEPELSTLELRLQDFIDNLTMQYLRDLANLNNEGIDWDIDSIHQTHEVAREMLLQNHGVNITYP